MIKKYTLIFLLLSSPPINSQVQFNPMMGMWMGNICANPYLNVWTYVSFLPVGSFCQFMGPNGMLIQGQIANQ